MEGFWGERLDKVLATLMPDVSRARLQKLIEEGSVEVNGEVVQKVRQKVTEGDEISLLEEPHLDEALAFTPEEDVEFDVVYEDDAIVVVNKPAGLVVHPGAGNPCGTLLNGLLWRYPELREVPRAGIVHRLDRDTTGLMVVARTLAAQTNLVRQLQERTVKREYWAFTLGSAAPDFVVETPIGRYPRSRTDKVLATLMPDVSRARLQKLIEEGSVEVNGEVVQKVRQKVTEGDEISLLEEPHLDEALAFTPEEDVEFDVVYEDDAIVVVNKPAGLVVHPGAGNPCGTLLNGLLWRYPELREVPRAGIVHRLDRDTTGLMVVARTLAAQTNLVRQLQERTVKREYWAFTLGSAAPDFVVETPIGRDPRSRTRFKCFPGSTGVRAKPARTRARCVGWSSIEGLPVSWVACRLDTGRTHQIRVHLTSEDLPLIGDQVYRGRAPGLTVKVENELDFHRQALHASRLGLDHPVTGEYMEWFVPPEDDMIDLMDELGFGPWNVPVRVFENERL